MKYYYLIYFVLTPLFIMAEKNGYAQTNSSKIQSCSTPPQNCINCQLTLTCIGVDQYGNGIQYDAKDSSGNIITGIPTTTCDQEGYWSCPDLPIFTPPPFMPPKDHNCEANFTSLQREESIISPLYIFVKDIKPFETLARASCQKSMPSDVVAIYDFGVKSVYDYPNGFNWHSLKSTTHPSFSDFPINHLVSFGDSITLNGHNSVASMVGGMFLGMVSNGPVWVEHIARKSIKTKNSIELIDIANAGAAITPGLGDTDFGILDQIDYAIAINLDHQLSKSSSSTDKFSSTAFSVMAGMIDTRDFVGDLWFHNGREDYAYYAGRLHRCVDDEKVYNMDPRELGKICANKILGATDSGLDEESKYSIYAAAKKLIEHGAQYLILSELPDFTLLPRYNGLQPSPPFDAPPEQLPRKAKQFLKTYIETFNQKLNILIEDLESKNNTKIVKLDLYTIYNNLSDTNNQMTKKARIKNTKYAGMFALVVPVPGGDDPNGIPRTYKAEESLFWDDAHPTETASCVIGEHTLQLMHQRFGNNKAINYKPDYKSCYHSYFQLPPEEPDESKTYMLKSLRESIQFHK